MAVRREQVKEFDLPTRPTKSSDTRAKKFQGDSVELDAIPAGTLREMVKASIERHIAPGTLAAVQEVERHERETLAHLAGYIK